MAVLVTGGAGYIGSHMALELSDNGETVIVLDNLSTGSPRLVPLGVSLIEGDIGDEALLGRILSEHPIDAIFHFAGSIVVPDSVADPLGYYLNNTVKSRGLIAAALAHGVKHFIFSSTAAVYGVPERTPVSEDAPMQPISPYGWSKLMTERMLADTAAALPLRYCALRYFNVAGADAAGRSGQATPRATHLIKAACEAVTGKRAFLDVYGTDYPTADGTCVRDYIHVTDLARAHWQALLHLRAGGDNLVLNCGYGRGYSVLKVIDTIKHVSGVDFDVRFSPRRAGDPAELVAGIHRIHEWLPAWRPQFEDLELIVEHALNWERKLEAHARAQTVAAAE
ncbi:MULTISPECIES: UDP-glucose 4-epimerase GalE [Rhodomicrobium]|uniref:UDP-glucose 4-epimerase GalE n=1 Tax=Rhodomicrobium TaxID=1068 RepID=UPI000B4B7ABE|nr:MULTISPECIES: UDP-glucose 4-epimerase GalE [Rhodomicrobium]